MDGGNELSYAPMVDLPDGVYHYGPRDKQDRFHGFLFGFTGLATLGLGIFACTNVNPHYEKLADPSLMKVGDVLFPTSPSGEAKWRVREAPAHFFSPQFFFFPFRHPARRPAFFFFFFRPLFVLLTKEEVVVGWGINADLEPVSRMCHRQEENLPYLLASSAPQFPPQRAGESTRRRRLALGDTNSERVREQNDTRVRLFHPLT